MIYTCTLNPAIDYVVHLDRFEPGELNRALSTSKFAGGKGINVSRVLTRFGAENTALGFLGGFTGDFIINELDKEGIRHRFIRVAEDTRINVKVKAGKETEINGQGPTVTLKESEQFKALVERLNEGDILLLAGSVLSCLPKNYYTQLMELAKERGIKVAVDTSGPVLKELLQHKPFFIKPNHHELGELFQTSIQSKEQAIHLAKKLMEKGIENVIISMAGEGALFVNKDIVLSAKPPQGQVKNSVGAGDSMVAGFLAGYVKGKPMQEAFRFSVAAGSATAFSEDLCTKEKAEQLYSEVQISEIE
ncbi:1-phosphofructokinase [Pseudobacillus wudalianchiensis]|uniref:Tagatose-6-phosphate kinase n=1 Tax=Pseudobacillus wudalianchiensis TaxID=1743143 RepID=A0A1B9AFY3_9BACI|nr:1-phosphofructokinase [Bacillus wudalianchiensis]OCA82750.1 1-phosphofructokinase [Bacillus wudalianchiensis]